MTPALKKRLVTLARKHLSASTKKRIRRVQYALLGRRARAVSRSGLPAAKAAFNVRSYDEAASHVSRILRANPNDLAALEMAARICIRQGAYTEAGTHAVRRAERSTDPAHWSFGRKLVGRTRETDPRWEPRLGMARPTSEPHPGRVLYLAKESRPFLHNGFCTRTHETLHSLAMGSRDVLGVTMPGFPGVLGIDDAPTESLVEDVRYLHLLPNAGDRLRALGLDEQVELTARTLAGVVATERPALLHVASGHRGFESALAGNAVARWAGIPWLYEVRSFFETTWTDEARYAEHGEYYERRFATESRMMRAADLVVTLSGPMRREIVDQHGVPADNVHVVPNAVDIDRFQPRLRDESLRSKLGLTGTFTLGYVSNLAHPREGQEVLVEAVAMLRRQGRAVSGLIVGDGNRRPELERLASKLGVAKHVIFTGSVPFDEVRDYYSQIDLFVVPRVDDRAARMVSPMKPFEAMSMRIPLLVANLPALAEIVGKEERGHLFRPGDPASLASAASRLIDAPEERDRIVEVASAWVAQERSWSAVAKAFASCYDELVPKGVLVC